MFPRQHSLPTSCINSCDGGYVGVGPSGYVGNHGGGGSTSNRCLGSCQVHCHMSQP